MKKVLTVILVLMMVLSAFACTKTEAPVTNETPATEGKTEPQTEPEAPAELPKVNFWTTGSQNVCDVFTSVIQAYNAKADRKCNVELQFILSGSGDETLYSRLAAAYKTGQTNSGFDMIAENGGAFQSYVDEAGSEDVLLDIDTSKLSNYDLVQLEPVVLKNKLVPYRGTTVVFAYNSDKLPDPPKTWEELVTWIKANDGRFAYNTPDSGGAGAAFVRTAIYRFIEDQSARMSNDEKWAGYWDEGYNWLADIHPYLYKSGGHVQYPTKNQGALDVLISEEIWMTPAWADQVMTQKEAGTMSENIKMYQLSDGALAGSDVDIAITSIGSNVDACYDFINFVISPEGQQILVDQMKAVPVIDSTLLEQTASVAAVGALNPSEFAFLSIGSLGDAINNRWTEDIATLG